MRRMYSKPQLLEAVEQESKLNGIKIFEDIKDKDGHARFIEGSGVLLEQEGVEITYAKWSLSGTHLLIVLAANIANGTVISNGVKWFQLTELPAWVAEKIIPVWDTYNIENKTTSLNASDWSTQNTTFMLAKSAGGVVYIVKTNSLTLNANRSFRLQFDLLLDNE